MAATPVGAAPRNPAAAAAAAACRAFNSAFSRKLAPDSSGPAIPSSPMPCSSKGRSDSSARNSRSLPGLPVATMSGLVGTSALLGRVQAGYPRRREVQQLIELVAAERVAFRGALHFDERAAAVHHHVPVRLFVRVLGIVQIEHRRAAVDAH